MKNNKNIISNKELDKIQKITLDIWANVTNCKKIDVGDELFIELFDNINYEDTNWNYLFFKFLKIIQVHIKHLRINRNNAEFMCFKLLERIDEFNLNVIKIDDLEYKIDEIDMSDYEKD